MSDSTLRILVVDDDPIILDLMTAIAKATENTTVESELDSSSALKKLEETSYDIILTDLMMPEISGLDILQKSKELRPQCLVALVTGYGDMEEAIRALQAGAYGYIHKPFRREELALILRNMIQFIRTKRALTSQEQLINQQESFIARMAEELHGMREENERLRTRLVAQGISHAGQKQNQPGESVPESKEEQQFEPVKALADLASLHRERKLSDEEYKSHRKSILNKTYGTE